MFGAESVSVTGAHPCQVTVENADNPRIGAENPRQDPEQRRLPAPARPVDEDPFAAIDAKLGHVEDRRAVAVGEAKVADVYRR